MDSKLPAADLRVAGAFHGEIRYTGNSCIELKGDFGDDFRPIIFWQSNVLYDAGTVLSLFLELGKDKDIELKLQVRAVDRTAESRFLQEKVFPTRLLRNPVRYEGEHNAYLTFTLHASGKGTLKVGNLHYRYLTEEILESGEDSTFLPGDRRFADGRGQEIFSCFRPMDMKPPLNVFFSGYRHIEGFDGNAMMEALGAPYLLLSDHRLSGGSFYFGTRDYEDQILKIIWKYMNRLGFTEDQVILSGLSMGATAALYYGAFIHPHAIITGKPIVNLGTLARNETTIRPGGFSTALDIVRTLEGGLTEECLNAMDRRFWDRFDETDFTGTEIAIAYMQQDDYDGTAYFDILKHLEGKRISVYGKGIEGRHNDNSIAVNRWFRHLYYRILREDFER